MPEDKQNGRFYIAARIRLVAWLTIGYTLFIVYGSLSPFSGWRDQGLDFTEVLRAPFQLTYTAFDAVINLLSYLPFGLLVGLTLRKRFGALASIVLGLCAGMALSASMEYLQMYLPTRTSSNMDLLSNSAGTLFGAILAVSMISWTWPRPPETKSSGPPSWASARQTFLSTMSLSL